MDSGVGELEVEVCLWFNEDEGSAARGGAGVRQSNDAPHGKPLCKIDNNQTMNPRQTSSALIMVPLGSRVKKREINNSELTGHDVVYTGTRPRTVLGTLARPHSPFHIK